MLYRIPQARQCRAFCWLLSFVDRSGIDPLTRLPGPLDVRPRLSKAFVSGVVENQTHRPTAISIRVAVLRQAGPTKTRFHAMQSVTGTP